MSDFSPSDFGATSFDGASFGTTSFGNPSQTITISAKPAKTWGLERIVRPFVAIDSAPPSPPPPRQPLPGEDSEAFISWGGPSRFIRPDISDPITTEEPMAGGVNVQVQNPKDKQNKPSNVIEYTEVSRQTETIRVENPDDEEQYVMVKRIQSIDFQTSDGKSIRLTLNWD